MSAAFKNRTRDEIIAAFRESIRRKHEWEEQAQEEFKRIREERRQKAQSFCATICRNQENTLSLQAYLLQR